MTNSIDSPYEVSDQWMGKPRPVRVVVVGSGIAGIAAVKLFREKFDGKPVELVLYEKNHDVGGTWLENRYPGCRCDVPAHAYTYSWEGNPRWSKPYVGAEELFDYFKGRATAYGVFDYIKLQHQVTTATWDDASGKWKLTVKNNVTNESISDECHVLINAGGFLNNWKWPEIEGIKNYKGHLAHSASWDNSYDFKGKRVAVIGSGSSAIQIVPIMQKQAKTLVSFNRSPTWITPEIAKDFAPEGESAVFSEEQKDKWASDPQEFLRFRKAIEANANTFYNVHFKDTEIQRDLFATAKATMQRRLNREDLNSILIPTFAVGCRRMTPGHGYLEALASDNVTVRGDPISHIDEKGIVMVDGSHFELDSIICATGFDTSYRPSFSLFGENGRDLRDYWKEEPRAYFTVAVDGYPNYFMATGPNFPLANGSLIASVEASLGYAFEAVKKIQTQGIKGMAPTLEALNDFQEHKDALMQQLVWSSNCRSWYKNGKVDGKVWGPWCGSVPQFIDIMSQPRWEDYKISYNAANRFQYLGKGRTEREANEEDLAWYVKEPGAKEMSSVNFHDKTILEAFQPKQRIEV